jgi:hypothetical protein
MDLTDASLLGVLNDLNIKLPAATAQRLSMASRDTAQFAEVFEAEDLDLGRLTREEMMKADPGSAILPAWAIEWFLDAIEAGVAFPKLKSLTVSPNGVPFGTYTAARRFWTVMSGLSGRLKTFVMGPLPELNFRSNCEWHALRNLKIHSDDFFHHMPLVEEEKPRPMFPALEYLSIGSELSQSWNFELLAPNLRQLTLFPTHKSARWIDDCTFPKKLRAFALSNYLSDHESIPDVSDFVQRCFTNLENSGVSESIQTLSFEVVAQANSISLFRSERWRALQKLRMLMWESSRPGLARFLAARLPPGQLRVAVVLHCNRWKVSRGVVPFADGLRLVWVPDQVFGQMRVKTVIVKYDKSVEHVSSRIVQARRGGQAVLGWQRVPTSAWQLQRVLDERADDRNPGIQYIVQVEDDLNPVKFPFDEIQDVLIPEEEKKKELNVK